MALVRVWNDNEYPYREEFDGGLLEILPHKFVEMDENKAIMFKGSYSPIVLDAQKRPKVESLKMIRIEKISSAPKVETQKFICQFDGKEFLSQSDLDDWIDSNHLDKLTDKKVADERRNKKK